MLTKSPALHNHTKYINIRYHFIQEQVEAGILSTHRVATEYNIADIFTKPLPRDRHKQLLHIIRMVNTRGGATLKEGAMGETSLTRNEGGYNQQTDNSRDPESGGELE